MASTDVDKCKMLGIESLDTETIKDKILEFKGHFKLDFTREYLDTLASGELVHILLAAMEVNQNKQPQN